MALQSFMNWTRRQLARLKGEGVPVTNARASDALVSGRVATPPGDLFENQDELLLVLDVPGATPRNTQVTWNEADTLTVYVQRDAAAPGAPWYAEQEELDWYRELVVAPQVDGSRVSASVRDGVATIRLPKRQTTSGRQIPVRAG